MKISKYAKNFSYLSAFEVIRVVVPFLVYPFLAIRLGAEKFGLVIFAQTVVSYFNIVIDYGFNISAVQIVAQNRYNKDELSKIISTVFFIKGIFFILSFFILFGLFFFLETVRSNFFLFLLSMSFCFHETVIPIWFFHGMEKMKNVTLVNFTSKLIYVILVFVFIKSSNDYLLVPTFNLVGSLFAATLSFIILRHSFKLKLFLKIDMKFVKSMLKDGFPLFLSRLSGMFNSSIGKIATGFLLGMDKVAIYDVAQKIVDLFKIPFSMLNQVVFPEVSRTKDMGIVKKMMFLVLVLSLFFILGLFLFGDFLVGLVGGGELDEASTILKILSPVVLFSGLSFFLGNTVLIVNGFYNAFNYSVMVGAFLFLLGLFLLMITNQFSLVNVAVINVIVFFTIMLIRWSFVKFKKLI